jgi:DnaJ-class molecular chaperone
MENFKILDLPHDCSDADVKKKYFALAQKFHPDRNRSEHATERFKLISDAYNNIQTQEKRARILADANDMKYNEDLKWSNRFRQKATSSKNYRYSKSSFETGNYDQSHYKNYSKSFV